MPQQRKRRRSGTATGEGSRARKRTTTTGVDVPGDVGSAAVLNSSGVVDISGVNCCPADVKTEIMAALTPEERTITHWTFPFKDGERFESAEFTQLQCYGPPTNKGRYVLCAKLGEGSFSCVFKSWDTVAREFVAMKFTLSSAGKEEFNVVHKLNTAGRLGNGLESAGASIIQVSLSLSLSLSLSFSLSHARSLRPRSKSASTAPPRGGPWFSAS
jgi:hypothetical protein